MLGPLLATRSAACGSTSQPSPRLIVTPSDGPADGKTTPPPVSNGATSTSNAAVGATENVDATSKVAERPIIVVTRRAPPTTAAPLAPTAADRRRDRRSSLRR